jgi:hypothetical protein
MIDGLKVIFTREEWEELSKEDRDYIRNAIREKYGEDIYNGEEKEEGDYDS